jgi:Rps23 Pro-64 3,4-dihydroxylase Tpa1-like proline 4-hydroxylase
VIKDLVHIQNFLKEEERLAFIKESENYEWKLTGGSGKIAKENGNFVFWYKNMINSRYWINFFKEKIMSTMNLNLEDTRFYLNGQSYGQCGSFHRDVTEDSQGDYLTAVYFPGIYEYNPIMGGHFMLQENDQIKSILPHTNSIVIFNSKLLHVGLEPTRFCKEMRTSLAAKYKVIG